MHPFYELSSVPYHYHLASHRASTSPYTTLCKLEKSVPFSRWTLSITRVHRLMSRVWATFQPPLTPSVGTLVHCIVCKTTYGSPGLTSLGDGFVELILVFMGRIWGPGKGSCLPGVTRAAAVTEIQTFALLIPVGSLALEPLCLSQITQPINKELNSKW